MAKSYDALAARAKKSWSDDAHRVNRAAGKVFKAELDLQRDFGRDIANARHSLGMTQPALAEVTGINQSEISRIENGLGNPTLETIARLTTALEQSLRLAPAQNT
ncbi:MAG: helix-turn-helix domain-containing protein [Propionibacteriaceae bacterium]